MIAVLEMVAPLGSSTKPLSEPVFTWASDRIAMSEKSTTTNPAAFHRLWFARLLCIRARLIAARKRGFILCMVLYMLALLKFCLSNAQTNFTLGNRYGSRKGCLLRVRRGI